MNRKSLPIGVLKKGGNGVAKAGDNRSAGTCAKKQSWVKGAMILCVGGFIAKLLGAVYRIPLTHALGAEGMGIYQMIFPLYALILAISSGGIPTALSRLVAEKIAVGQPEKAGRIARNALISLSAIGILLSVAVAAFAPLIARLQGNSDATLSYYLLSPSVALVAVIAALRGYFQGKQNMLPSALSQILEQAVKLGIGLGLAILFLPRGVSFAAAGAVLGVTVSEVAALGQLVIQKMFDRTKLPVCRIRAFKSDTLDIYRIAIPVTLGGIVIPLTQLIDSAMVINILKRTYDISTATALYGLSGGPVGSLINLPVVISLSFATAILPSIAACKATNDWRGLRKKAGFSIRLTVMIALPCFAAFLLFPRQIIMLLYSGGLKNGIIDEPTVATNLLALSSVTVLLVAVIQIATALLHATGHNYIPIVGLLIGAIAKVVIEIALLPGLGIYAVAVSNIVCFLVAAVIDGVLLWRHVSPQFSLFSGVLKPVLATVIAAGIGCGIHALLGRFTDTKWLILPVLGVSAAAYILLSIVFGVFSKEEMSAIPLVRRFFREQRKDNR